MLAFLFMVLSWLSTSEERKLAKLAWKGTPIKERYYFSGHGLGSGGDGFAPGDPACDNRFFIDTVELPWIRKDGKWGTVEVHSFHFEGWFVGLGYWQEISWARVNGKFHLWAYDHADYSYHNYPVQRGK